MIRGILCRNGKAGLKPMQTTALRYFLTVARSGSISAAAKQLNVAASAISRQIAGLEAELDCVLFERRPRGMALSPAGELLAAHAHRNFLSAEQITTEIRELRGLTRGLVRVATTEGFALDLLPAAMATFQERYPGIRFELTILPPTAVPRQVSEGDADVGLTFVTTPAPRVAVVHEAIVDLVVVSAPGHPVAGRSSVGIAELAAFPIALQAANTTARQIFDAACAIDGVTIEPALTANALAALLPFMLHRNGLCVLSEISIRSRVRNGELAVTPIRTAGGTSRRIQIQTMSGRKLPRAVETFVRRLLEMT